MAAKQATHMKRSWLAWVCLVFPAGFVWSVTPLSWLFWAYVLLSNQRTQLRGALWATVKVFTATEVLFSVFLWHLSRKAQEHNDLAWADLDSMRSLFLECLNVGLGAPPPSKRGRQKHTSLTKAQVEESRAHEARLKYQQWFFNAKLDDIYAENVKEWICWAMVGKDLKDLKDVQLKNPESVMINDGLNWLQHRLHYTFKPGYNPKVKSIRLSLDKVPLRSRPLAYYVVTNGVTLLVYIWMVVFHGFRFKHEHNCTFITRSAQAGPQPKSTFAPRLPIVFLHGLGIGIGQYMAFLRYLVTSPQPVLILLQPNISTQIFHPRFLNPPSKEDHVLAFKAICQRMHFDKGVTVLSHSNGTMVHAWLLRGAPELCKRNILVDPVCFRLWEADVCHAFLHQPWLTGMQVLLGYFVARELGTAHSIARDFVWTDMMLWEWEIPDVDPHRLHIVLGSDDFLIDCQGVLQYLRECGIEDECITVCDGAQHGAALIVDSIGMQSVLKNL